METNNKKILLVGLYYFENLGDPLYMLTTKKLLETKYNATVDIADIYGRTKLESPSEITQTNTSQSFLNKVKRLKPVRTLAKMYHKLTKHRKLLQMYEKMIKGYDAVVVPGGGVISLKKYPFHKYFYALQKQCKRQNVCFCMNAVGITNIYGEKYRNTKKWEKIINSPQMTYFSARDGIAVLENICGEKINYSPCTAILSGELFNIKRDSNSKIIGIGIIKGDIFTSNGMPFSEIQLIDLYIDTIHGLRDMGYEVKLFTNGFAEDRRIANIICEKLGEKNLLMDQADSPVQLVSQIASFKAIVCARMHSSIIAASLNIPTVLLSWGIKSDTFMTNLNAEDSLVRFDKLTTETILQKFKKSLATGWDDKKIKELKENVVQNIDNMWKSISN